MCHLFFATFLFVHTLLKHLRDIYEAINSPPYFHSHTTVFERRVKCTIFMCGAPLSTEAHYTNQDHPACNGQSDPDTV